MRKQAYIFSEEIIKNIIKDFSGKIVGSEEMNLKTIMDKLSEKPKTETKSKKCTKKAINNENNVVKSINDNSSEFTPDIWEQLSLKKDNAKSCKVTKKDGFNVENTDGWSKLKEGTKEKSASPKSDICIFSTVDGRKVFVSLKSGKGRFTSSDCYETNAILQSVLREKHNNNPEIKDIVESIVILMKQLGKKKPIRNDRTVKSIRVEMKNDETLLDEDIEWIQRLNETVHKCNGLWNTLKNKHPEYVKEILFECVSGGYKFANNVGRAEWLFVTIPNTTIVEKYFKLDKRTLELDEYLLNEIPKKPFAAKSAGTGKMMWIRFL